MRELEIPLHTDTAVFDVPVRHSFLRKAEVDMSGIADARRSASSAKSGVEKAVVEREGLFLIAEVHRPRRPSHTQSNRIEGIKVPDHVAGYVLQSQHVAEAMLQPGRQLRDSGVLEGLDEEVLTEIDRVDDVLETEKVGLAPHDLLLAQPQQVGSEKIPAEVEIGFAHRIVVLIAVVALETQVIDRLPGVDTVPACGRYSVYHAVVADVLDHRLRETAAYGPRRL